MSAASAQAALARQPERCRNKLHQTLVDEMCFDKYGQDALIRASAASSRPRDCRLFILARLAIPTIKTELRFFIILNVVSYNCGWVEIGQHDNTFV
jgi:hypothetical protein